MALTTKSPGCAPQAATVSIAAIGSERVAGAYDDCVQSTRHAAANFYYGIRLLPVDKRRAMSAVYAFSRRVDDIGDGTLDTAAKLAALDAERERLALLCEHQVDASDPVLVALADAWPRFELPIDALVSLIDGVELDVRFTTYETFDELVVYCRHVAGSIGRLCLAIFGAQDRDAADPLADDLGVAMQLTNILRDVREDCERGRVYLPAEDLRRFEVAQPDRAPVAQVAELIRFEAARNREWFVRGLTLADLVDSRSRSCLLAMTGIYRCILDRIERQPAEVLRRRISLPVWEKAWLAASSVARAGAPVGVRR
ncbi:MAG: presqualene diphosphate synthase HpnD [Solirubrobacteraceae bacterium]